MKFLINTILDGFDVEKVNLWDHPTLRNNIVDRCTSNQEVELLTDGSDGMVLVRTSDNRQGWCNSAFLKPYNESLAVPSDYNTEQLNIPESVKGDLRRFLTGDRNFKFKTYSIKKDFHNFKKELRYCISKIFNQKK